MIAGLRARFDAQTVPEPNSGCLLWLGHGDADGYGRIRFAGKAIRATHAAILLSDGEVPGGAWVLHRCDNPGCVRRAHLFLGDHAANVADKVAKGRQSRGARHSEACAANRPSGDRHYSRTRPELVPRGEQHASSKLTLADVSEIRARSSAGETYAALGRSFGVTPENISSIVRRKTWGGT
jgi:hypothetical protein